ncbi:uncharacterized protein EI90DRAFT_110053 [Cantharellus anzutake]|uniref:uncharacterized protein n=1 Tax=Cantharellus anzutake TaxID=1750568 RepID=UPI0019057839|nr:uncharacterized protein EI90DRAFT_110053 [Cantharellus anzutake]KAF8337090.1 hypothetical protein EI90DRAFT_110053 [Cantharellus anzutake]
MIRFGFIMYIWHYLFTNYSLRSVLYSNTYICNFRENTQPPRPHAQVLPYRAWKGSVQYYSLIQIPATCLLVVSTFLVGECDKYWQFMVCQGFTVWDVVGLLIRTDACSDIE